MLSHPIKVNKNREEIKIFHLPACPEKPVPSYCWKVLDWEDRGDSWPYKHEAHLGWSLSLDEICRSLWIGYRMVLDDLKTV